MTVLDKPENLPETHRDSNCTHAIFHAKEGTTTYLVPKHEHTFQEAYISIL